MTDLSYTNKDGLSPAEGFVNIFNYHKDGNQDGDGYEHGGYPEITGETSPYTDTSYKTGDKEDFFDNGNVWVQPSVNPGPGPEPEPTYIELFRIGNFSQVYQGESDNPYGETVGEEGSGDYEGVTYWDSYNADYENMVWNPDGSEERPHIAPIAYGPNMGDYASVWTIAEQNTWSSEYDSSAPDFSEIITTPDDLLNLKVKLTCNGTQYIVPIVKYWEYDSKSIYDAGQTQLGYDFTPGEAEEAWTHPFMIEFSQVNKNELKFQISVNVRYSEDIVLENVVLVKEETEEEI